MERSHQSPESTHAELIDTTGRTREQLRALISRDGPLALNPTELYLRAPGVTVHYTDYIDKGCRGGWSEHRTRTLDDEPYRITLLSKKYRTFTAELRSGDTQIGSLGISLDNLDNLHFLEAPSSTAEYSAADELIHELATEPYRYAQNIPECFGDAYDIIATSRNPLEDPLTLRRRDDIIPLYEEIEGVELLRQGDQALVRLHFPDPQEPMNHWLPLEHVRFEMKKRATKDIITQHLFHAARRLLAYHDIAITPDLNEASSTIAEINQLIAEAPLPVCYLPEQPRRSKFHEKPTFVVGTPADDDIKNIRIVEGAERILETPFITANNLTLYDKSIWVVDNGSSIALPLTTPGLVAKNPGHYDKHLTKYIET